MTTPKDRIIFIAGGTGDLRPRAQPHSSSALTDRYWPCHQQAPVKLAWRLAPAVLPGAAAGMPAMPGYAAGCPACYRARACGASGTV